MGTLVPAASWNGVLEWVEDGVFLTAREFVIDTVSIARRPDDLRPALRMKIFQVAFGLHLPWIYFIVKQMRKTL
jgi:hypothetical protein